MARAKLSPRKEAVQARGKQTVEAILEAAAQVFVREGYAGGTTNHIAERAGVSVGSVYQYFPNKDAILVALVQRHLSEGLALLTALFAEARSDEPLPRLLRRFVEAMARFHSSDPRLHRLLFEEAPHPASLRRELQQLEESMAEAVASLLQGHPEVRVRDLATAAYLAVHVVEGLVHHFVLHAPAGLDEARFVDEVVALLDGYFSGARG